MFEKHGTGDEPTSSHRIGEPDGGTRGVPERDDPRLGSLLMHAMQEWWC